MKKEDLLKIFTENAKQKQQKKIKEFEYFFNKQFEDYLNEKLN